MRRRPTVLLALAFALVLPGSALAVTQTSALGQVSASLSYSARGNSGFPVYSQGHLTIIRAGKTAYSQAIHDCRDCQPGAFRAGESSVKVVEIDGGGEPNVVLSLFSGGANCCFIAQVFTWAPAARAYVETRHDFLNPGFTLKRLTPGGRLRFVSADASFIGALTSDAASGTPLQIWSFGALRFTDVTRRYPALIRRDAGFWLRVFKRSIKVGGTGALAAWAADEEMLGHDRLVQRTLQEALRAGHLTGGFVNGRAYITALNQLLRRYGYRR